MIIRSKIFLVLFLSSCLSYGQMNTYRYQRKLIGVNGTWQKMSLPENVLSKLNSDLSDIRIYGINASGDTIEAPYLLRISQGKITSKDVESKILNSSRKDNSYYYTFDISSGEAVNNIMLHFTKDNFEWKLQLEGSNDQHEWFTLLENYRILSIRNDETNYSFTKLTFPKSTFRYFRLKIPSSENPQLSSAKISQQETEPARYRNYDVHMQRAESVAGKKETVFNLQLNSKLPVSYLKINVRDTFDYYRPVRIVYVTDSFNTEKGWKYNYATLGNGTLNSIEENEFHFSSTLAERIRIEIYNGDNMPLNYSSMDVKGYLFDAMIRITEPGDYFLVYGKKNVAAPRYDIERFDEKISATISPSELQLGEEKPAGEPEHAPSPPFFQSKAWLWSMMGIVILLLGWFTMKMMRKNAG